MIYADSEICLCKIVSRTSSFVLVVNLMCSSDGFMASKLNFKMAVPVAIKQKSLKWCL